MALVMDLPHQGGERYGSKYALHCGGGILYKGHWKGRVLEITTFWALKWQRVKLMYIKFYQCTCFFIWFKPRPGHVSAALVEEGDDLDLN
jgi:hypothetical protein